MAGSVDTQQTRPLRRVAALLTERRRLLHDYAKAISGAGGRLVFSLAYFVFLANTLTLADFGVFATVSAAGIMLSRILGFGFVSTIYRIATVKPLLIGTFTGGFMLLALLSLPVMALAAAGTYALFFAGTLPVHVYTAIIFTEALLWRPVELAIIVNNGLGAFGRASLLTILAVAVRAGAAVAFALLADATLATWSLYYVVATGLITLIAYVFFYPHQRLRLRPKLYWRRLPDSLSVAGAEVLFYLQMEFDKFIVLAMGGAHLAGIYAVIMRLVELTAIPIRTFTMMLVQKMMRAPAMLSSLKRRAGIEFGVFAVSTAALGCLALLLYVFPNALGRNVAQAASLIALAFAVPGTRNLVEYQAELLFARGQTFLRAINLALLAGAKAVLLAMLLTASLGEAEFIWTLNGVFVALYLVSAALTYSALRMPAKRI